jgi:hypothetical protein
MPASQKRTTQCFVEQKNGAVVRQFVGYDRYEGEAADRQLVEVYRALRLYVNFVQPWLKLKEKHRVGTRVRRMSAQVPFERLIAAAILTNQLQTRLDAIFAALDPMRLPCRCRQRYYALDGKDRLLCRPLWQNRRVCYKTNVS